MNINGSNLARKMMVLLVDRGPTEGLKPETNFYIVREPDLRNTFTLFVKALFH